MRRVRASITSVERDSPTRGCEVLRSTRLILFVGSKPYFSLDLPPISAFCSKSPVLNDSRRGGYCKRKFETYMFLGPGLHGKSTLTQYCITPPGSAKAGEVFERQIVKMD